MIGKLNCCQSAHPYTTLLPNTLDACGIDMTTIFLFPFDGLVLGQGCAKDHLSAGYLQAQGQPWYNF